MEACDFVLLIFANEEGGGGANETVCRLVGKSVQKVHQRIVRGVIGLLLLFCRVLFTRSLTGPLLVECTLTVSQSSRSESTGLCSH